jgi:hypothetical protein
MPRCRAKPNGSGNATVAVDNGITLTEASTTNIDVTLALAKAAIEAGTVEQIDNATTPKFAELPANGSNV